MLNKAVLNLLFTGITISSTALLRAQTWELINASVPGAVTGNNVRPIETDGTRLYVLGDRGVYISSDNGNSFAPINDVEGGVYSMTNLPGRFIKYVNGSVWVGWDPGSAAYAGSGPINYGAATLHRLTPGETVWHKSSSGFPVGDTGNQADDIAYDASTGTYYAGAALGGAFVSTDGLNWEQRANGLGGIGLPTSMVAFNGMAFELRPLAQVYKTTSQGTNWTGLQSHLGISSGYLLEKNGRILFASSGNNSLQDSFNYSDDYGATWNHTTQLRGTADLSQDNGIIYSAGVFGGVTETVYGRYAFKFSATDGITWDNLPTNGLPVDSLYGFNATRVVRQGNYLFMHSYTNLYRCDVSGFNFTPTTQIVSQPPATTNFLVGQTVNLSVLAGGANLTYQWFFQSTNLDGATNATFSIPLAQTNHSGTYQVTVVGDRGSVTSSNITLTVGERGDGKYDITYNNPATGGSIYLMSNSSLLSVSGANLYKMNPTGEKAVTRNIGGATFSASLLDSSNRLLFAGNFTQAPKGYRLMRVSSGDLTDDMSFGYMLGQYLIYFYTDSSVLTMAELPGRGYLIGGNFLRVTNSYIATNIVNHLCLLDYSGVVDTNFVFSPPVSQISKIIVVGETNIYVSATANKSDLKKVNLDGTWDTNFSNAFPGNNVSYYGAYVSNKIFAVAASKPVLLNPDGTLDSSFNSANATFNNTVTSMAVGESNNLYVVGTFTSYNGQSLGKYARLFPDGTVDTSFFTTSPTSGGFSWDIYDARGYLYVIRDNFSGTFQGQSYGTGPYRLFAGISSETPDHDFNSWAAQFNFPPGQSGPGDDADGDGIKNVFEYYFGSNPTNSASSTNTTSGGSVNVSGQNYPAITFIRVKTASGVTLLPQASSNVNFSDSLGTVVNSVVDLGNGTERVTIRSAVNDVSQSTQFLRIQLSIP